MELKGKTAIVTGGAIRLGRALALGLAEEGVNVVLHYCHSQAAAEQTGREIEARGVATELVRANFENLEAAAEDIVTAGLERFGSVEVLINSAAIFEAGTLSETSIDLWDRHFDINLKAPFFLAKAFARQFQKSPAERGHILNILDWRATHPSAGTSHLAYTIAKSGLAALTKALAVELGPKIQVNGIAPGAILPAPGTSEAGFQDLAHQNPLNRVGSPTEIVKSAVYLLKSDFLTGEILHVDGGERLPT